MLLGQPNEHSGPSVIVTIGPSKSQQGSAAKAAAITTWGTAPTRDVTHQPPADRSQFPSLSVYTECSSARSILAKN
jgi:hypothetical protein